jgi:selenocysteine lyase/cysteine desulfurase
MEHDFDYVRSLIVGQNTYFQTPYGRQPLVYADWTASGRLYAPIEAMLSDEIGPWVANTHTETNTTGTTMTVAYHQAQQVIKKHVNASSQEVLIACGSGMTGALAKLQRIMGLKVPAQAKGKLHLAPAERPVVFITHMEHHSNQTSWLETLAEVRVIEPTPEGLVDLAHLQVLLEEYKNRPLKIASVTSCSNVTGVFTPYHEIAELMHQHHGWCFVDFACSAPYIDIDMNPANPAQRLDAVFFSPHKFLGGVGTPGILIFNRQLYDPTLPPDQPGGGTVKWTNPWGQHSYVDDIEAREDGGTPPFMQTIRAALAIRLKENMGPANMLRREKQMLKQIFARLERVPNLHILAGHQKDRLGVVSFYIDGLHYNLGVKLLNDRFGIQVRGGCSCAGTYGHYLLNVSPEHSDRITQKIEACDLSEKPGWIRLSVHPTTTDRELDYLLGAVEQLAAQHAAWAADYQYCSRQNNFYHRQHTDTTAQSVAEWFGLGRTVAMPAREPELEMMFG